MEQQISANMVVVRLHPDGRWRYLGYTDAGNHAWYLDHNRATRYHSNIAHKHASKYGARGWDMHIRAVSNG